MNQLKCRSFAAVVMLCLGFGVCTSLAQPGPSPGDRQALAGTNLTINLPSDGSGSDTPDTQPAKPNNMSDPDRLQVAIYPILGYFPVFGADLKFTDDTGAVQTPNFNSSLTGAYAFGFTLQKNRFYLDGDFTHAGLTVSRSSPNVKLDATGHFSHAEVGYRFYSDFFFTGGFRYLGLDYTVTAGGLPPFTNNPSLWDPLVGMMWSRPLSKKVKAKIDFSGGGFGVGADADIGIQGQVDWRFTKHFGAAFGYGFNYIDLSHPVMNRTFHVSQTLNGPLLGVGVYF